MLEVAAKSFTTNGYTKTSLDDVATALNVTKPALYYYAKSKEDILMQCAQISLEQVELCFKAAQDAHGGGLHQTQVFFRHYANLVVSEFGSPLTREARRNLTGENQKAFEQTLRDGQNLLVSILKQGVDDGSIRRCNTKLLAQLLFSAFNQMPVWYSTAGSQSPAEIADELLELVIVGISATSTVSQ